MSIPGRVSIGLAVFASIPSPLLAQPCGAREDADQHLVEHREVFVGDDPFGWIQEEFGLVLRPDDPVEVVTDPGICRTVAAAFCEHLIPPEGVDCLDLDPAYFSVYRYGDYYAFETHVPRPTRTDRYFLHASDRLMIFLVDGLRLLVDVAVGWP